MLVHVLFSVISLIHTYMQIPICCSKLNKVERVDQITTMALRSKLISFGKIINSSLIKPRNVRSVVSVTSQPIIGNPPINEVPPKGKGDPAVRPDGGQGTIGQPGSNLDQSGNQKRVTFKERTTIYLKSMYKDYRDVYFDTIADAKAKPTKATVYVFLLGGVLYCIWSNPDERDYFQTFIANKENLELCASSIRNPGSEAYLNEVSRMRMKGILRHQSLGLFSIVWKHNEDPGLGLYSSQCDYTKPLYLEMWDRLIDVGFWGRWWILENKMVDFDINNSEWEPRLTNQAQDSSSINVVGSLLTPK